MNKPHSDTGLASEEWTTVLRPESAGGAPRLQELWRARDLIYLFVRRDFVTLYKQTILGPAWFFIQPLLTTLVFTVVFGNIARISTDGVPPFLFYMSGVVVWSYFASCLDKTAVVFAQNQAVFSKVYFPRLAVPISIVITNVFAFLIQYATFVCFVAYYAATGSGIQVAWWAILITPLLLIQTALLGIGCGLVITSLTTKYRDLAFVVGFGLQLWMYATPIVYPLSAVPDSLTFFVLANPMAGIVETFRLAYFGVGEISLLALAVGAGTTLAVFLAGVSLFAAAERTFIDTI